MNMEVKEEKLGIPWCVNCVGWHPDKFPNLMDYARRIDKPQVDALLQYTKLNKWEIRQHYKNRSCMLCGRSYDNEGELDKTWKMTARRVHEELQRAGLFGVDEKKVDLIVAKCRKSFEFLFKNRFTINPMKWERFTFGGCLALIITHAQASRASKNSGGITAENIKGPVVPGKLN